MIRHVVPPTLALIAISAYAQPPTFDPKIDACIGRDDNAIELDHHFKWMGNNCVRLTGGYSSLAGSFARLSYSTRNDGAARSTMLIAVSNTKDASGSWSLFGFDARVETQVA